MRAHCLSAWRRGRRLAEALREKPGGADFLGGGGNAKNARSEALFSAIYSYLSGGKRGDKREKEGELEKGLRCKKVPSNC